MLDCDNNKLKKFSDIFIKYNSKLNLVSKNDVKYLYEKHILDSLSLKMFFDKYNYLPENILDIGTGGGFPSIPLAIAYPNIQIVGVDSILKKINAIQNMANELQLKNIQFVRTRIEDYNDKKFDCIVSRAVAKVDVLIKYAYPLLSDNGYLVLYKSKNVNDEILSAGGIIKKYSLKQEPLIKYDLELDENYQRFLVIFRK